MFKRISAFFVHQPNVFYRIGEFQMPPTSPNLKKLHLTLMNWNLVVDELATNATGT